MLSEHTFYVRQCFRHRVERGRQQIRECMRYNSPCLQGVYCLVGEFEVKYVHGYDRDGLGSHRKTPSPVMGLIGKASWTKAMAKMKI